MRDMLRTDPVAAEMFRYVYVCSFSNDRELPPSDQDFENCAILCEQVDWKEFPHRDRLPADCKTILFPSLDSMLLWPFNCGNPYNVPDPPRFPNGRFVSGDRVILKEIDRDLCADDVLSYYLTGWESYKINIKRVIDLERVRVSKRDARCDVTVGDLVLDNLSKEPLFWTIGHPRRPVLTTLMQRLLAVCSKYEPSFRRVDVANLIETHPEIGQGLSDVAVPVHPKIAEALELSWYDPNSVYQQYGGFAYSYEQYFSELINYSITNKQKILRGEATTLESGWQLPIQGPAFAADVSGYFPDGFIGQRLMFLLTAEAPVERLAIRGYCPGQHHDQLILNYSVNNMPIGTIAVKPASQFTIECAAALERGQSATIILNSSTVMNLLARGESEDARDLSVLLLSIDVIE